MASYRATGNMPHSLAAEDLAARPTNAVTTRSHETGPDPEGANRTDRQVGWLISLGGAALILGRSPALTAQASAIASWWLFGVMLLAVAVLCLAALGRVLPFRLLRFSWVSIPVLGCCLWMTSFLAHGAAGAEAVVTWVWTLEPVVASFLVLWVRPVWAVSLTVLSAILPAVSAVVFLGTLPPTVLTATPMLLANVVYLAIFFGIRSRLGRLRVAESRAREQHRLSEAAAAEASRQKRLRLLIHDQVLSTLTAAMSLRGPPPEQLRDEARHALLLLDASVAHSSQPLTADPSPRLLSTEDALVLIDHALRRIDPECRVHSEVVPGLIPVGVIETIADAASEALRNSIKHAGEDQQRSVDVRISAAAVRIVVRDKGQGFVLEQADPARLGVRESIVARMRSCEGGEARIRTEPGSGTEVELTWEM